MSFYRNRRLVCVALVAVAVCACSRGPATESRDYPAAAERANAGLVAPLKNDTSEEIVSWVDGQVVTDWAAEIEKRDRAINGYLNDTDPARAATYGFRNGQNPQLAWSWFRDNPVGFNGVPFVLFKTILDLDPNHENPTLRAIARIWKRQAIVPSGSGTPETGWTLDHIGTGPAIHYVDGVAPGEPTATPLPTALRSKPRTFEPRRRPDGRYDAVCWHADPSERPCLSPRCKPSIRKTTGNAIDPPLGAQVRWIACSFRAPPATSAA